MKFDKVVFINENAVGDVVLSTPIIKAFREQFPDSKITFLVRGETAELVKRLPFIDEVICYAKGDPMFPVLKKLWRYDTAICLDFKYRSAVIPFFAAIPVRAGMAHKRKLFLSHPVERDIHEKDIYETANFAGIIERSIGLKLKGDLHDLYVSAATKEEQEHVTMLLKKIDSKKLKIAIAPFSSNEAKNWSIDSYKLLLEQLTREFDVEFLILGSKRDKERFEVSDDNILDLRGQTTLSELAEVLRRADYFIGSCSGPLHIAAAAGIPIVALYGATSSAQWASRKKTIVVKHDVACSPCDRNGYNCDQANKCMNLITVDEVFQACSEMIKKYPKGNF